MITLEEKREYRRMRHFAFPELHQQQKQLHRDYNLLYRLAFPKLCREQNRLSQQKYDPVLLREYQRFYRLAFASELHARRIRYYAEHRGQAIAYSTKWNKNNRTLARRNVRLSKRRHPETAQRYSVARRARLRHSLLPGLQWEIDNIYDKRDALIREGFDVEVDHIYPLGFGWHEPVNLQIIYAMENKKKSYNPNYQPSRIFI